MATVGITGTDGIGSELTQILLCDDIEPGTKPGYQTCKTIYTQHVLGAKLVDTPITKAQSEPRDITIQDAPEEVLHAFLKEWEALSVDDHIANVMRISRIYGIGTVVLGCEAVKSNEAIDMTKIWDMPIFFNELDPLNTAGSLVLSQVSTAADFNKPKHVWTGGQSFHRSRYQVVMHEAPVFLDYTDSAFGFVGRSVYQRALYPLKSFIRAMIANDAVLTKLALLVAKQQQAGSIGDKVMDGIAALKRIFLKFAKSGEVLSIGPNEEISTLNMQNVDGAGTFARTNVIKDIATAADMPAKLLDNETLVAGFGEGTEDAKQIVQYLNGIRRKMQPVYAWFDNIVRYRAWSPRFYRWIQGKYPERYKNVSYEDAFFGWRQNFTAEWPSLLMEARSETIKIEQCKFEVIIATLQTLIAALDPVNRMRLIQWASDNISENKMLFAHELAFDYDSLETFLQKSQIQVEQGGGGGGAETGEEATGVARKLGKFDSADVKETLGRLRQNMDELNELVAKRKAGPEPLMPRDRRLTVV